MSFGVDVNVLIDAANEDSERQSDARAFLEERLASGEIFCLPWLVAMSFLRITTDPRMFRSPLPPAVAIETIRRLLAFPQVQPVAERPGFFEAYADVGDAAKVRGRLVPDAHLATILRQHGVRTLYTSDRDFRRFDFLDVRDPFTA